MPNLVSPGVYTVEQDVSDYIGAVNSSVVGIVGFASRGPVNKPTLITEPNSLIATFGDPSEDIYGQGLEGALTVMSPGGTNSLYFVRAATTDITEASASVNIGACPAVVIREDGYGVTKALHLRIQATSPDGEKAFPADLGKVFSIPIDTATSQGEAIRSILPGTLLSDRIAAYSDDNLFAKSSERGIIVGMWAGSGAQLSVEAASDESFDEGSLLDVVAVVSNDGGVSGLTDATEDITAEVCETKRNVWGAQFQPVSLNGGNAAAKNFSYVVESKGPGAGYNLGASPDGTTSGVSILVETAGEEGVTLSVFDRGSNTINFPVSMVAGSFIEDVIGIGSEDQGSPLIKGNLMYEGERAGVGFLSNFMQRVGDMGFNSGELEGIGFSEPSPNTGEVETLNPRFIKLVEGNKALTGGSNGAGPADVAGIQEALIGDASDNPKSGIQALDTDALNISIGLVPGVAIPAVQDSLISVAQGSQNFLALVAPPYGLNTVQDAIDWSNGQSFTRKTAISSSFAAAYWPWVQSTVGGTTRWVDPSIYAAYSMCYTDDVSEPWFAPAGQNRGSINNAQAVETTLSQGDRDTMYSGGNILNPIVSFGITGGVQVFGQRTAQRKPSALDRVNIRRMMIFLRKAILNSTRQFIFEPNDSFTWDRIKNSLNPFLNDIKKRRGITQFRVVCDETTNTPARVDRNEMWCKVLIKPTKTAEMIVFELNLTNQSATVE